MRCASPPGSAASCGGTAWRGRFAPLPADQIGTWRNGELLLRDIALDRAIGAIARYRPRPVYVWGDLSDRAPVSGAFRIDRPDQALATLAATRGIDRLELPGGILILRR